MDFRWRTESDDPAPEQVAELDDRTRADEAMQRANRGEWLLYTGDFHNAKQLLSAMSRRVPKPRRAASPLEAFRAERVARAREHQALSRLLVALDGEYRLALRRAPDVAQACRWAWGEPDAPRTLVPLKTLLGVLGAAEWRRKGLAVPGLKGTLEPHYGVYLPTRSEYVELVAALPGVEGKRVIEVGTGTGVLSFVLLQRGAASALATDVDPRAVRCANENARRLGLAERFEAVERDLFPEGRADLVVCNPPWIPEPPKTRLDRAVFDEGSAMVTAFVEGLSAHLAPGGAGVLVSSDLAVLLGLRRAGWLDALLAGAGLTVTWSKSTAPKHGKAADRDDPLHAVRSRETTTIYRLATSPPRIGAR